MNKVTMAQKIVFDAHADIKGLSSAALVKLLASMPYGELVDLYQYYFTDFTPIETTPAYVTKHALRDMLQPAYRALLCLSGCI